MEKRHVIRAPLVRCVIVVDRYSYIVRTLLIGKENLLLLLLALQPLV